MPATRPTEFLPEALNFLQRLVSENSFTGNRAGVLRNAGLVAAQFAKLGFSAEQVRAEHADYGDHLFLHRPGRGGKREQSLLLVTHLDTVFPPEEENRNSFHWLAEGDRIYGPGVVDNKGGTAMIWLVLAMLQATQPEVFEQTSWLIAANAAEEELVKDFPARCRDRLPAGCRAALGFESCAGSGDTYSLVECRKGSINMRVSVEGRGAHAGSRHQEGANAIVALSALVGRMAALTDYDRKLTVNVGQIVGGGPINRVPHQASCEINIRAFDEPTLQGAVDAIEAMGAEDHTIRAASDGYPCKARVETLSRNPAWPRSEETDQLLSIWKESATELGIELTCEARGGLSDGNYISQFLPTLDGLGPLGRNGHASERSTDGSKTPEFVVPESFVDMSAVNVAAILRLLRE